MEQQTDKCMNCQNTFAEKKGGYNRHSFASRLGNSGLSVREGLLSLLPESSVTPDVKRKAKFLCHECFSLLSKATSGRAAEVEFFSKTATSSYVEGKKRKTVSSTPSKSPFDRKRQRVDVATSTSPFVKWGSQNQTKVYKKRKSWKNRATELLRQSKFKSLFFCLYHHSSKAAKDLEDIVRTLVNREVMGFGMCTRVINQQVTIDNVQNFGWEKVLTEYAQNMPILFNCISATCCRETVNDIIQNKTVALRSAIGNIISTLIFLKNRKKYKFLPALHSVAMWRNGCTHKLFEFFSHLGLSLGVNATRKTVDRLRSAFDSMILDWKTQLQDELKEGKDKRKPVSRTLRFEDTVPEEQHSLQHKSVLPGYTFCWDNVQLNTVARHQSKDKQSKVLLWAMSFAVENRVPTAHLEMVPDQDAVVNATKIPLQTFLPRKEDFDQMRDRMTIIVARILCKNFAYFAEGLGTAVPDHIEHQHSDKMREKSQIHEDTGHPFSAVCFGDGLSVERMVDGKKSRANGVNKWERLEGLEPCPQEFHKRMLLMQDTMDELFTGRSAGDRGTLYHIKNVFNKRSVKKSVKDAFNHTADFIRFVTEGYVCLFAKTLTNMPLEAETWPCTEEERWVFLRDIAVEIVDQVWHNVPEESLLEVLTADVPNDEGKSEEDTETFAYCCLENTGEDMIECSNPNCHGGQWFHLSCVDVMDVPEGDWWCSNACRDTRESIFCVCRKHRPDLEMVRCGKKERCCRGEWFHINCVKISVKPTGCKWFCSVECKKRSPQKEPLQDDGVYKYSCALVWRGLNDLIRRDAVREGDGPAILCHWKADMLEFWRRNHHKYLIFGHRLLAGTNGFLPKRLAEDMTWNRTANLGGREGNNIELDLLNEFINNDFKENLKHARGMYTEKHVARTAQMVGTLGKAIEKVYEKQVVSSRFPHVVSHSDQPDIRKQVLEFVEEYENDQLVITVPGREHSAFPGFSHDLTIMSPAELKKRFLKFGAKLQRQREILPT